MVIVFSGLYWVVVGLVVEVVCGLGCGAALADVWWFDCFTC